MGASSGAGDLAIDRPALRALVAHFERTGLPREPGRERRATRWRLGWTWRSFLVAVLWTLASTYLAAARTSIPTGVLVSILPALWVGHRAEPLLAVLRDSVAGRGMLRARLLRVVPRGLVVDDGRDAFVEAVIADPRDGSSDASRRLGPLTWASGSRVLVAGPAPEGYRSSSGGAARGALSVPARSRARRAAALALLALLVLAFGAAATASYRTLWPAFRRLERPPATACGDAATIRWA